MDLLSCATIFAVVKRVLAVLCVVAVAEASLFGSDVRQRIWTLDLSTIVHHAGDDDRDEYVWGLAFSPDESKLAIGFGLHWDTSIGKQPPRQTQGHLVVLSLDKSVVLPTQDLGPLHWGGSAITWAPSGSFLVAQERDPFMFRLDGKKACSFPSERTFAGFLSGDRMVFLDDQRIGGDKGIELLGPDCSSIGAKPGPFREVATCPGRDLILSSRLEGDAVSVKVHDSDSWHVRQNWKWSNAAMLSGIRFADGCRKVCTGAEGKPAWTSSLACWDVGTGQKVSEDASVVLSTASIVSSGGELIATTDHRIIDHTGKVWVFLDMDGTYLRPKRQVVWSIRTGREVASWPAQLQRFEIIPGQSREHQFLLALSASGKYLAEGGSGTVTLYRMKE